MEEKPIEKESWIGNNIYIQFHLRRDVVGVNMRILKKVGNLFTTE